MRSLWIYLVSKIYFNYAQIYFFFVIFPHNRKTQMVKVPLKDIRRQLIPLPSHILIGHTSIVRFVFETLYIPEQRIKETLPP
jgi:hypothetical protein